jgi:glycosyltransferase involved in cell wall biosynthesis
MSVATDITLNPEGPSGRRRRCPFILVFATQGSGHGEEVRIRDLLGRHGYELFPFDRKSKRKSGLRLLSTLKRDRPDLVVMEGTGSAGGMALIVARLLWGVPYVVSSGDAVAPFLAARKPLLGPFFRLYERLLCRLSAGFIGWTPYLVGRALTLGAPRGMTAAGWAPFPRTREELAAGRARVREKLGIPAQAIVFGIVGTLDWNERVGYCYGSELVRAALGLSRADVRVLVAGDGTGLARLKALAGDKLGSTILLPGRIPRDEVPDYLAAMDVGSLPQSVDGVGSFRYTTKLSEYFAASLPVVTGEIPLAYDLDSGWLWKLPGDAPWDERYVTSLRKLMETITDDQGRLKRERVPADSPAFDKGSQVERVSEFLRDLLIARDYEGELPSQG